MRQQQKRMRGRARNGGGGGGKSPNPLSRSYESNGPDVKVRGTAATIAEKYVQLARDAQASGDPILAEAYLQHAEHYFRIIAAAQPQVSGNPAGYADDDDDDGEDADFEGPIPSMPQSGQPAHVQNGNGWNGQQGGDDQPRFNPQRERQPYNDRQQGNDRGYEPRDGERYRNDRYQNDRGPRQEGSRQDNPRQDGPRQQDAPRQDGYRQDGPRQDQRPAGRQDGQNGAPRPEGEGQDGDRGFGQRSRRDRFRDRQFDRQNGERPQNGDRPQFQGRQPYQERPPQPVVPVDQPQPDIDDRVLSALPSFITAPVKIAPVIVAPPVPVAAAASPSAEAAPAPEAGEEAAPRKRRAPRRKAVAEVAGGEAGED